FFPPSVAAVTKTLSPQTMGDDQPSPGSAVFQATFVDASHFRGRSASSTRPCPVGPRKRGQLPAAGVTQGRRTRSSSSAVFIEEPLSGPTFYLQTPSLASV